MAQIWTAGSPLFAIDPDMLAVMTMLPAIPRRFICCATAWMVKNVPGTFAEPEPPSQPVCLVMRKKKTATHP